MIQQLIFFTLNLRPKSAIICNNGEVDTHEANALTNSSKLKQLHRLAGVHVNILNV